MVDGLRLTRAQIAKAVGTDNATIRAFERLLSGSQPIRSVAGDAFLSAGDRYVVLTAAGTATLPLAGDVVGQTLTVKRGAAGAVTVAAQTGETIDGAATYSIGLVYESITVASTGTEWVIV